MQLPLYQLDAFTEEPFRGNPAAVMPLPRWLPDATMQAIAAENNLAETAFIVREAEGWRIRWFTPTLEIDLCGHATMASAKVVFDHIEPDSQSVVFASQSGPLAVRREGRRLVLDFPARPPAPKPLSAELIEAVGGRPAETLEVCRHVMVFRTAEEVRALRPEFGRMKAASPLAVAVTAPGTGEDADVDFVSRFFAPTKGVDEDPVTGSMHCVLVPFWAERLGKTELRARQVSRRGGELWCRARGDRVEMAGYAVEVLRGTLTC